MTDLQRFYRSYATGLSASQKSSRGSGLKSSRELSQELTYQSSEESSCRSAPSQGKSVVRLWGLLAWLVFCLPQQMLLAEPPSGSGFTRTLLKQQQQHATSRQQASETPAPIPTQAVLPWRPEQPARDWKYVVLHHSASSRGDVASIHQDHLRRLGADGKPWRGIAYHFVIGNGQGMEDGAVQETFRWNEQLEGAHAGDVQYNQQGIGICLIGDFEQHPPTAAQLRSVQNLITFLRREYKIPASQVIGHRAVKATACPGKFFPLEQVAGHEPGVLRTAGKTTRSRFAAEDAPPPQGATIR